MKAIALVPGTHDTHLKEVAEPSLQTPTQVKVRVIEVGVCGTDREEVSGGRSKAPPGEKELIIGHEMIGEVIEVGKGVRHLLVGDLVVIMVRRPCAVCEPCKKGEADLCTSGQYTERGIKERHGFQTEVVVDEEAYVIKLPKALRLMGVLTEPTTVVEKAIDMACRVQVARLPVNPDPMQWLKGKVALVAGLGTIGLLASMVLRLRGAEVIGMDIVDPKAARPKMLEAMGGRYIVASEGKEFVGKIDCIVEAAGNTPLDVALFDYLGWSGVYVLTGVTRGDPSISASLGHVMRGLVLKNQLVLGSVNAKKRHFEQAALDLEAAQKRWPGLIEQMITSRTHYAAFHKVLDQVRPNEIKAVLTWTS